MSFAEKLSELRRKQGLSQEELAERLRVSRQAVSRWEQGTTLPDAVNLLALSDIFGVSIDYLLRDEQTEPQTAAPEVNASAAPPQQPQSRARRWLFLAIIWTVAAACWFVNSFFTQNVTHAALAIFNGIIAIGYVVKYENSK